VPAACKVAAVVGMMKKAMRLENPTPSFRLINLPTRIGIKSVGVAL
jgi:hypothetical protein